MSDADFERAWNLLAKIPTLHERGGTALGWLGRRRLREATDILERCAEREPQDPQIQWGLGRARHAAGDTEGAFTSLGLAAASIRDSKELVYELSLSAMALGKGEDAQRWARAAVDLDPSNGTLLVNYTLALLVAGHPKRALGIIANVCKREPDVPIKNDSSSRIER